MNFRVFISPGIHLHIYVYIIYITFIYIYHIYYICAFIIICTYYVIIINEPF